MNFKMTTKYKNKGQETRTTRTTGQGKLGSQPKQIGRTRTTNYHYRVSAYKIYAKIPQELTDMKDPKAFKKWINRYLINPKFLPSILKKNKKKPEKMKWSLLLPSFTDFFRSKKSSKNRQK